MSNEGLQQAGDRDTPQGGAPAAGGTGFAALAAKVGGPRNVAVLGAGATVAVIALINKRRGSSATSASSADPTAAAAGSGPYDSGPYDMWDAWQQEYEYLQQQITAAGAGTHTATGPGTATTPKPPTPVPINHPPTPAPAPPAYKPVPKPKPVTKPIVTKVKGKYRA